MGTTWSARGFGDFERAALADDIAGLLRRIVSEMSQWAPDSDISRFNALPKSGAAQTPEGFAEVLTCALAIAAETDGAFDPSLGALVDMWGFGPRAIERAPREDEVASALAASGWRKLAFNPATRRLTQPGGLQLDFAGVAKGYAVDRLARLLSAHGATSHLVEIGGEARGCGVKPDGQPWWVEIEQPPDCQAQPIVAALYDLSIATSGDYRRAGMLDGAHVTHTIDPRTGRPLVTPVAAVTVLHAKCMWADAYATALTIMGVDAGLAFADQRDLAALFTLRGPDGAEQKFSSAFARQLDA